MAKRAEPRPDVVAQDHRVGTYIAYDADRKEMWRMENFSVGEDSVPRGISLCMVAGVLIDAKGKETHRWDPKDLLKESSPKG